MAGALSYAMLLRVGDCRPAVRASGVATVAAGCSSGRCDLAAGRPAPVDAMARRLLAVAAVAFVFRPLAGTAISGSPGRWPLA